ncbi:MAG: DUF3795 domain-containing protein [Ruminococcus sp.]|nr:DUF3795 domain-containing protein [Ruminococcus sp.]MCM1380825.1 DUF3795 domain-containing protein [Muribaculaceae bacterium]
MPNCVSRCGLDCTSCENREKCECPGCLELEEGNWAGDCEIKLCCEQKRFEHCGFCPHFPCDMLRNTAFDPDEGDDGERLVTLKRWLEESSDKKVKTGSRLAAGFSSGAVLGAVLGAAAGSFLPMLFACTLAGTAVGVMINIMKGDR